MSIVFTSMVVCVVIASLTSSSSSSNGENTGVYVGLGGSFTGAENIIESSGCASSVGFSLSLAFLLWRSTDTILVLSSESSSPVNRNCRFVFRFELFGTNLWSITDVISAGSSISFE